MAGGLAVLAIIRHHENIGRLIRGEESKIGAAGRSQDGDDDPS